MQYEGEYPRPAPENVGRELVAGLRHHVMLNAEAEAEAWGDFKVAARLRELREREEASG